MRDVRHVEVQCNKNPKQLYFRMDPRDGVKIPSEGAGLLLVLPGQTGSADFRPFVKRIVKNAVPADFVTAQLVAPKWEENPKIVWPTAGSPVARAEFTTEQFALAVIAEVSKLRKIDPKRILTLSWSSGGPAAYALALQQKSPIAGSFIAMSVYHPNVLPPRKNAKGKSFYLFHSPEDKMCKYSFSEAAEKDLTAAGARVKLQSFEGGHAWTGPVYPNIRAGFDWLTR